MMKEKERQKLCPMMVHIASVGLAKITGRFPRILASKKVIGPLDASVKERKMTELITGAVTKGSRNKALNTEIPLSSGLVIRIAAE